jgi:hypothetical protein
MTKRALAGLLVALLAAPSAVFAQATKAGVVTTLEGNVTARRVALPNPMPLKFKDEVFLQDTVSTGNKSLARILLGGKAVVTVRELSVLTITEVPGKSTIDLDSGKFSLAVARERMRPGEEILIRTPNAIAAVHGTVLVAEVKDRVTTFSVLQGGATAVVVYQLNPTTKQPIIGTQQNLRTGEASTVAGTGPPSSAGPVSPQVKDGLTPSGPTGGSEAGQEQVKAQAVQGAVTLLAALNGASGTQFAPGPAPTLTTGVLTPVQTNSTAPITVFTGKGMSVEEVRDDISELIALINFPPLTGNVPVAASTPFRTFSGTVNSLSTSALIKLTNAIVAQLGADFIDVLAGANVTLAGPLATLTNSTLSTTGAFLSIANGSLRSTTPLPFIALDPSAITTGSNWINVSGSGARLTLAGPLFKDVGGTLVTGGADTRSVLVIHDSAVVKDTSTDPFISLTNSTITSVGSLLSLRRSGATPSTLELAGPFLSASGGTLTFRSTVLLDQNGAPRLCCSLFPVGEGAVFKSTTTLPLISLAGTSVNLGQNGMVFFDTTSIFGEATIVLSATATLAGPLFKATASANVSGMTDFLGVFRSSVTSTTTQPFLDLNGVSVSMGGTSPIDGSTTAGRLVNISANNTLPSSLRLQGPLLNATNATIFTTDDVFSISNGAIVSSTTTAPLISISGGSVTTGPNGNFLVLSSGAGLPGGSTLTLAGPFLQANDATINIGDPTKTTTTFAFVGDGAQVRSTSTAPFMSFTNSSVDAASDIFDMRRSTATATSQLTLAGPLLTATNSTFNHTSLGFGAVFTTSPSACCSFISAFQGAQLSSSTTSALVQLTSSTVIGLDAQSGGNFFNFANTFSGVPASELVAPAIVTLAGPLLTSTNSTITELFSLLRVNQSSLSSTTTSPLVGISGGTVTSGGINTVTNSNATTALLSVSGGAASTGSLTLSGPALSMTNGATLNLFNSDALAVFNRASLTSTTQSPLISVTGSAVTQTQAGGAFVFVGASGTSGLGFSTLTLNGPLLSVSGGSTLSYGNSTSFVSVGTEGSIIEGHPTLPFLSFAGGAHTPGSTLFNLRGRTTATASEIQSGNTLTLGTDQPLQRSGTGGYLELSSGATAAVSSGVVLDTALLAASAPLFDLKSGSSLTITNDAINLNPNAKLTAATGPLVRLDASTLNLITGSALRLAGGSFANIGGDLVTIGNGGTLTIGNIGCGSGCGGVLSVSGGSVVNISGALVNFLQTTGNQLNIRNTLCSVSCTSIGGVNVFLTNGALAGNVSISGTPIKNAGAQVTLANGATTAVVIVNGATSKVTISGN